MTAITKGGWGRTLRDARWEESAEFQKQQRPSDSLPRPSRNFKRIRPDGGQRSRNLKKIINTRKKMTAKGSIDAIGRSHRAWNEESVVKNAVKGEVSIVN